MRRFLAAQFAPVLRAWRNGYEAEVRRAAIAFFLLVFLAFGVCLAVPELRLGFSAYLQHLFQGMDLTDGAGNLSPLLLLANNLRACAVTMLYGLIPFVRLPALALGVNAVLLGGLAACYAATDTTMLLYAASLLPHGIFDKDVGELRTHTSFLYYRQYLRILPGFLFISFHISFKRSVVRIPCHIK